MSSDWLPRQREKVLEMAGRWSIVMAKSLTTWGIPGTVLADLNEARFDAEGAFNVATGPERTHVSVVLCNEAFETLINMMRDIKRQWFTKPPLQNADFAALGLPIPDDEPTPHPTPEIKPTTDAVPFGKGRHTVTALNPETEDKKRPDEAVGVFFAFRMRGPDEPQSQAADMPSEYQTETVKSYQFTQSDYGKVADYATAYSGGPKKRGPWSDVVSLVIS